MAAGKQGKREQILDTPGSVNRMLTRSRPGADGVSSTDDSVSNTDDGVSNTDYGVSNTGDGVSNTCEGGSCMGS